LGARIREEKKNKIKKSSFMEDGLNQSNESNQSNNSTAPFVSFLPISTVTVGGTHINKTQE